MKRLLQERQLVLSAALQERPLLPADYEEIRLQKEEVVVVVVVNNWSDGWIGRILRLRNGCLRSWRWWRRRSHHRLRIGRFLCPRQRRWGNNRRHY